MHECGTQSSRGTRESDIEAEIMRIVKPAGKSGEVRLEGGRGGPPGRGTKMCEGPREERTRQVEGNESSPPNPDCEVKGKNSATGRQAEA